MLSETRLRLDAIHFVRALRERWVAVPAAELRRFRIHLKGQQGIFKPAELSDPLSITTTIASSYTHDTIEGSCVYYDFVRDHENDGLKRCAEAELPLIYFLQVKARPAEHVVFAPVYVIGWDDERRRFSDAGWFGNGRCAVWPIRSFGRCDLWLSAERRVGFRGGSSCVSAGAPRPDLCFRRRISEYRYRDGETHHQTNYP